MELQSRIEKENKCPYNNRHAPTDAPSHLNPLPPSLLTPTTPNPPSPSPANCAHWCFPEAWSLCRRSLLASSFWRLWWGEVIPPVFIRPSFTQPPTDEWSRTLIRALPLQSPAPQHLLLVFLLWGRQREVGEGSGWEEHVSREGMGGDSLALR